MPENGNLERLLVPLESLSRWLNEANVNYTFVGGVAICLVSHSRPTKDIDLLVRLPKQGWPDVLKAAANYGLVPRLTGSGGFNMKDLDFLKALKARVLLLKHRESGIDVDLNMGVSRIVMPGGLPWEGALRHEREMLERCISVNMGSLTLRVPTLEDLVILKFVTCSRNSPVHRKDAVRLAKDTKDLHEMLAAPGGVDLPYIKKVVFGFADELDKPDMRRELELVLEQLGDRILDRSNTSQ
jgi:hypothetical protein